jgi:hypothetical protein
MKDQIEERPEGIIITISRAQYQERGYRNWLRNFRHAMDKHDADYYYWLRVGSRPTQDKFLLYVYLCIGNRIRYRGFYAGHRETPEGFKQFDDGRTIRGRHWILIAGPVDRAPMPIQKQGFQGFRYTPKLF